MKTPHEIEAKRANLQKEVQDLKRQHDTAIAPDSPPDQKAAISQFYNRRIQSHSDKISILNWVLNETYMDTPDMSEIESMNYGKTE